MVLSSVNLASGIFILLYNFCSSAPLDPDAIIATTQNVDQQAENDVANIMRLLDDAQIKNDVVKAKLSVFITELAKRVILAERKADTCLLNQGVIKGALESEKDSLEKKSKKAAVFAYLRSLVEIYEWFLGKDGDKLPTITDEQLKQLGLPLDLGDNTIKNSVRTHYATWLKILQNDEKNPKVEEFKSTVMPALGFKDDEHFAKSAAYMFCVLSNIGHSFPVDLITFKDENDVIQAIESWQIKDPLFLNAARAFYRLIRLPGSTTRTQALCTT